MGSLTLTRRGLPNDFSMSSATSRPKVDQANWLTVRGSPAALQKSVRQVFVVFVRHVTQQGGTSFHRMQALGLTGTRPVTVHVEELDIDCEAGVMATRLEAPSGELRLRLQLRSDIFLDESILNRALTSVLQNRSHQTTIAAKTILDSKEEVEQRVRELDRPKSAPWQLRWADLNVAIVTAAGAAEFDRAMRRLSLPPAYAEYVARRWSVERKSISVTSKVAAGAPAVQITRASTVRFGLRVPVAEGATVICLVGNSEQLCATKRDTWNVLAWAYASWVGGCVRATAQSMSLPLSSDALAVSTFALHQAAPGESPLHEIPNAVVAEYIDLLSWLQQFPVQSVVGEGSDAAQLIAGYGDPQLTGIMRHSVRPVRRIELRAESGTGSTACQLSRVGGLSEVTIRGDLARLASESPLKVTEAVSRWICTPDSRGRRSEVSLDEALSNPADSRDAASAWTWVRLFWRRHRVITLSRARPTGGEFLLGSDRARSVVADWIIPTLRQQHAKDPRLVDRATACAAIWIVDFAHEWNTRSLELSRVRHVADLVSVIVAPPARLLHFDGRPDFSGEEWGRVVHFALSAPVGLSWFVPGVPSRTNRQNIVAPPDSPEWFGLNERYRTAGPMDRERYRVAIGAVRELAARLDVDAPTPTSSAAELQGLYRAVMRRVHPDARGASVDEGGVFHRMQEAFRVLRQFHDG